MEPFAVVTGTISIVSRIIPILKAALLFRSYVKGREGLLDRKKWKESVRLGPEGSRFHSGWYIALEGELRWQYFWGDGNPQDNAGETTHNDPPQGDSIRLELIEEGSHGSEDTFPLATGFVQLSTQWEQANSNARHHITIYETALPIKVRRYIKVFEEGQERRVVIECNTYARQGFADGLPDFYSARHISKEIKLLDASYIAVRSKHNWKKLFLLQFHHACLRLFFEFLTALEADEKEHADDASTDSGFAELWQWNLRTITQRSYEYRDLGEMGRKLISTTDSLIDVARSSSPVVDSTSHANKFMAIDMELRGLCREANERMQNFSDQLDHDLKYLELARDINQTRGVQQLTLLATIFLPLSLAAGVLMKGEDAEPGIFPVLDAMEDAFQKVDTDIKEISRLNDEAKEDVSILLPPELDADKTLLERAKDEKGEPMERFVGVGKLFGKVLPQLEAFLVVQNNVEVVLLMILEIIKAQRLVEEHGEGKSLQSLLKNTLGEALYEQILEAGAAWLVITASLHNSRCAAGGPRKKM
ncbi:hypothetical protein FACUT_1559 [Fusarium acutatum]|uniref:Uncharacterized protein n=1 Tax=Fusarium acutatum TaxID=78861 RepID=A0A8H4K3L8_9HYPO|nr:hypothetical protein FACUT_1559 [Fusarium acutatum]